MPTSRKLSKIGQVTRKQYGAVHRRQLVELGMTPAELHRAVREGWLERIFPRVFALSGSVPSWNRLMMAGLLYSGPAAVVTHRAACQLHQLGEISCGFAELSVPSAKLLKSPLLIQHERSLDPRLITKVGAFPVTTPAATVVDMARFLEQNALSDLVDEVLRDRRANLTSIRWAGDNLGKRVVGIDHLRTLLAEREDGSFHESRLESKVARILQRRGYPAPQKQYPVYLQGRRLRIDLCYPDSLVAIECDGYKYHSGASAFRNDSRRSNLLMLSGWRVLRVTWGDLKDPALWLQQLDKLLEQGLQN